MFIIKSIYTIKCKDQKQKYYYFVGFPSLRTNPLLTKVDIEFQAV